MQTLLLKVLALAALVGLQVVSAEAGRYKIHRGFESNSGWVFLEVSNPGKFDGKRFYHGTSQQLAHVPLLTPPRVVGKTTEFTYLDARLKGPVEVVMANSKMTVASATETAVLKPLPAPRLRAIERSIRNMSVSTLTDEWLPIGIYKYRDGSDQILVVEASETQYRVFAGNHRSLRSAVAASVQKDPDGGLKITMLDGAVIEIPPQDFENQDARKKAHESDSISFVLTRISAAEAGIAETTVGAVAELPYLGFPEGVLAEQNWQLPEPSQDEDPNGLYIIPNAERWNKTRIQHAFKDLHGNLLVNFEAGPDTPGIVSNSSWFWGNYREGLFAIFFLGYADGVGPDQTPGWLYEDLLTEMGAGGSVYSANRNQSALIIREGDEHVMDRLNDIEAHDLMRSIQEGELKVRSLPFLNIFHYYQLVNHNNDLQQKFLVVSGDAYQSGAELRVWLSRLDGSAAEELIIESVSLDADATTNKSHQTWTLADGKGIISVRDENGDRKPKVLTYSAGTSQTGLHIERYLAVKSTAPHLMDERFTRDFMADLKVKPFIPRSPSELFVSCELHLIR